MKHGPVFCHHQRPLNEMLLLRLSHQYSTPNSIGIVIVVHPHRLWPPFHFSCVSIRNYICLWSQITLTRGHSHRQYVCVNGAAVTLLLFVLFFFSLGRLVVCTVMFEIVWKWRNGNENIRNFVSPVIFNGAFQRRRKRNEWVRTCTTQEFHRQKHPNTYCGPVFISTNIRMWVGRASSVPVHCAALA